MSVQKNLNIQIRTIANGFIVNINGIEYASETYEGIVALFATDQVVLAAITATFSPSEDA